MTIDRSTLILTRVFVCWLLLGWFGAVQLGFHQLLQPVGGVDLWLLAVPAVCLGWLHWRALLRLGAVVVGHACLRALTRLRNRPPVMALPAGRAGRWRSRAGSVVR